MLGSQNTIRLIQRFLVNARPRGLIPSGFCRFCRILAYLRRLAHPSPFSVLALSAWGSSATVGVQPRSPKMSFPDSPITKAFTPPKNLLPSINHLEGFHPNRSSLYRRVLVPVHARESIVVAWLCIGDRLLENRISPTGNSHWPSPSQSV